MQRNLLKILFLTCALVAAVSSEKRQKKSIFTTLDQHIFHSLAYHYLWPWSQVFKTAAALDASGSAREPQIVSNAEIYQVNMNVKKYQPDELKVRVRNRYVTVEGKNKQKGDHIRVIASHFVQRFELPPGTKPEEVTAVYKENGVLSITAPKHEIPPPPPEREVPIEVRIPEEKSEKPEVTEEVATIQTSTETPLEQLDLVEATTHVGKTRKKELKSTAKTEKENEVTKGVEANELDYALVDSDTE